MERKEAMEIVRKLYKDSLFLKKDKEAIVTLIPELKESEDERIRKSLAAYFAKFKQSDMWDNDFSFGDIIAWLENKKEEEPSIADIVDEHYWEMLGDEKQGEQKQVIIAKFQIGDKVRLKGSCGWYNVAEIRGNAYYLTSHDVVPCLLPICEQDNWEVEQKPTDNDMKEALRTEYEKGRADTMAEVQNSAWSEADETALCDALWAVEQARTIAKDENDMGNLWCAERFLKSLKKRYTWKPSDMQMRQLGLVAKQNKDNLIGKELMTLYNDLKKLRG